MPINETIPTLPTPPSTSDPANFDARADAFLGGLPAYGAALNTFSSEANALAETVNSDSVTASDASTAAAGSANFAGAWSSLSGGLNIPASVSHEGKVWLLTVSIPNVAASEPDLGNSDWLDISPLQETNQITATASGALANGDTVIINSDGTVSAVSGRNASAGTPAVFESAATIENTAAAYDAGSGKIVIA